MSTVELTDGELTQLRRVLFRDLRDGARAVAENAEAALSQTTMAGEDALGYFRAWMLPTIELLDRFGWSTRADLDLAREAESRRRQRGE
jgi:hypothetical protein